MIDPWDNGSFWFATLDDFEPPEPAEPMPAKVDVAIVGAGFTGLWTAWYLKQHKPELDIAVFEATTVGFGASGRNGGWCMGWAMGIEPMLARPKLVDKGLAVARAMQDTVDEVGRVCQAENIDCHFTKGGTLTVATTPFHAEQLERVAEQRRTLGFSPTDFIWLSAEQARHRVNMQPNHGALFTPHCAAIHPARLVRGLGKALREKGVQICERTPVAAINQNELETPRGNVRAPVILRATEGYTDSIKGQKRRLMPLYSMMVATEPLPEAVWYEIGLHDRETFGDNRRVTIYGQRTLDGRIAFGGRAGYYFGSKMKPVIPPEDPAFNDVERTLKDLFPVLEHYRIAHRWGGLMGVPRHWRPFVTFDKESGFGAAGGYTGEGVGASNLAGRILADLVAGRDTELARLAWVDDVPRRWEPEPFRWLGARAIQSFGGRADASELRSGKPSRFWGGLFDGFVG